LSNIIADIFEKILDVDRTLQRPKMCVFSGKRFIFCCTNVG